MSRKKKEHETLEISDDMVAQVITQETIKPPFPTLEQNISWYIQNQGKFREVRASDLMVQYPYMKSFEEFKKVIDEL